MLDEIRAKRDEIYAIARKHNAEKLWVFGSCARKEERPDSDVDFLVKLSNDASGFASVRMRRELESLLGRNTDVISYGCIEGKPQYWFPRNVRKDMLAIFSFVQSDGWRPTVGVTFNHERTLKGTELR